MTTVALTVNVAVRLETGLSVTELAAGVERGRVVNLRAGRSGLTLRLLLIQGQQVARKVIDVKLQAQLQLDHGIELVTPPQPVTVTQPQIVASPRSRLAVVTKHGILRKLIR